LQELLDVKRSTAEHLARLLRDRRMVVKIRKGRRALGCSRRAVLVLRWFIDGSRLAQLACDNGLSTSTTYRSLHEGPSVPAAGAPDLSTALPRLTVLSDRWDEVKALYDLAEQLAAVVDGLPARAAP
jgi:hypothetical protein